MASNAKTLSGALTVLLKSTKAEEKRAALTYIRSNAMDTKSTDNPKGQQYADLCKLVVDVFTSGDQSIYHDAHITLDAILRNYTGHDLKFFQTLLLTDRRKRINIFQFLEKIEDHALTAVARDSIAVNFLNDCMRTVLPNKMPWTSPTACVDNLEMLVEAENRTLSEDQQLEEQIVNHALSLLQRLYKIAAVSSDRKIQRFDNLLMDKAVTLAYMGHKRQRNPALKVLQQVAVGNWGDHIRTSFPDVWLRYRTSLQNTFCDRMSLLVLACEADWATQWTTSIQLLGKDLHRGAGLINNLLGVEEKAFKSTDTVIRRQAFQSWNQLVDNFALDELELATPRRVKLLCIPLNAKNSKTELMALTKLEVWWHLINKLYKNIRNFTNPVLIQFLNFCFGPLGDTPLLSSKFNVVASPGKRFLKTKMVAIDALLQLLVKEGDDWKVFEPILEERLPSPVVGAVFEDCFKSFVHSVGEAILLLSQFHDKEIKNRKQVAEILWKNLLIHVHRVATESLKAGMYKDVVMVATELGDHAENKPMIRDLLLDTILLSLIKIPPNFVFKDGTLINLMSKVMTSTVLITINKNHCDVIEQLLWQGVKPKTMSYMIGSLEFFYTVLEMLKSVKPNVQNIIGISELWRVIAEMMRKYMTDDQSINEGDAVEHNFKTVQSVISFPFTEICLEDLVQVQRIGNTWKELYKQFDVQADLVDTVKPNEIVFNTVTMIHDSVFNSNKCCSLAVCCLDVILTTVNYKYLQATDGVPPIVQLVGDLSHRTLTQGRYQEAEASLRALSSVLITIYGHDPHKVICCLVGIKHTIEIMLQPHFGDFITKEIVNTWETIMSVFRGLGKLVTVDLLKSFEEVIRLAVNHPHSPIVMQSRSYLEIRDDLKESAKAFLEGLMKDVNKSSSGKGRASKEKAEKPKQVRITGSFLNRKPVSPKPAASKLKEKEETKTPVAPEPDSEDYVVIKSDFKFDASRLTEHQKESLRRRRDDIPALYNDLTQSCSQDTHNIQEWFDKKNQTDKSNKEADKTSTEVKIDRDANKENNVDRGALVNNDNSSAVKGDPKPPDDEGQNTVTHQVSGEDNNHKKEAPKQKDNSTIEKIVTNAVASPPAEDSSDGTPNIIHESTESSTTVAKKLDFESRTEFPDNKDSEQQQVSSSVIEGNKRRSKCAAAFTNMTPEMSKVEQPMVSLNESTRQIPKRIQRKGKRMKQTAKATEQTDSQLSKQGATKRKAASDSETEGGSKRRRYRRSILMHDVQSDSDSVKSTESEQYVANHFEVPIGSEGLSKRTKNEISRLRINMVFDGAPLPSRRRSKMHDESGDKDSVSERQTSPDIIGTRLRSEGKLGESAKRQSRTGDKEVKTNANQEAPKKRGRPRFSKEVMKETDSTAAFEQQSSDTSGDTVPATRKLTSEEPKSKIVRRSTKDKTCIQGAKATDEDISSEKDIDDATANVKGSEREAEMETRPRSTKGFFVKKKTDISEAKVAEEIQIGEDNINESTSTVKVSKEDSEIAVDAGNSVEEEMDIAEMRIAADDPKQASKVQESVVQPDGKSEETKSENHEDSEEIVESSQESDATSILDKKYSNKTCFIKINKIPSVLPGGPIELDSSKEKTKMAKGPFVITENTNVLPDKKDSSPESRRKGGTTENLPRTSTELENDDTVMEEETTSTKAVENIEPVERKLTSPESKKSSETSLTMKCSNSLLNSSSPKSNLKRFPRLKSVAPQGRAAHMLGLVTKQALAESDKSHANVEEDTLAIKKPKGKDLGSDSTAIKKDRMILLKEPERLGSPSGSRQEKIFNKMKTTECSSPTMTKLFSNLKNDGENVSPKADKGLTVTASMTTPADKSDDQVNDGNVSPPREKEELPMLEWSSANPPSLTASPSASILKRNRQMIQDPDPESPTLSGKRKRVSFADPPVSKEMGYEIAAAGTPHRMSKLSVSRSLLTRKESPLRMKQSKLKMLQTDTEKPEKDNDMQIEKTDETDALCDRQNEVLVKIADDLEYSENLSMDTESQPLGIIDDGIPRSNESTRLTVHHLSTGFEIASRSRMKMAGRESTEVVVEEAELSSTEVKDVRMVETQQDIFDSANTSQDSIKLKKQTKNSLKESINTSLQNILLGSLRFNITNDSVTSEADATKSLNKDVSKSDTLEDTVDIQNVGTISLNKEVSKSEDLEDTVDVQNVTGLNSTTNSDEIFCSRPVRTSTQTTQFGEDLAGMDTLPVTDSVFGSMPFSQSSQPSTQDSIQFDRPELLDSSLPIYPSLVQSCDPIGSVIGKLANPLWKSHLSNYFSAKGLQTIGDLAKLPEREINRLPVKGSPKVDFVRNILHQFEASKKSMSDAMEECTAVTPNTSITSVTASTPLLESSASSSSMNMPPKKLPAESPLHTEHKNMATKSTETQTSLEDLLDEIDASLVLKSAVKRCSAENILTNYKAKMRNMSESDLERETIRILGIQSKNKDAQLKSACRDCGVNKVLGRLPDIFSLDKQFFVKVLTAYRKKLKVSDCLAGLDLEELKDGICQSCTSSELAEMLSRKLKDEENKGITERMTELSSLNAMLKRMPKDLIISHTVANEELISPSVVLDIALQNNSPNSIALAVDAQPSTNRKLIFDKLCTIESVVSLIEEKDLSEESLLEILKAASSKLGGPTLLDAFHTIVKSKWPQDHPST